MTGSGSGISVQLNRWPVPFRWLGCKPMSEFLWILFQSIQWGSQPLFCLVVVCRMGRLLAFVVCLYPFNCPLLTVVMMSSSRPDNWLIVSGTVSFVMRSMPIVDYTRSRNMLKSVRDQRESWYTSRDVEITFPWNLVIVLCCLPYQKAIIIIII